MESNMVNDNEFISFIKDFFISEFPEFVLLKEIVHGPFWHIEYSNDIIKIDISGDIGFQIFIEFLDTKYPLWQYDRSVSKRGKTNIDNIKYQLEVLNGLIKKL